MKRQLFSYLSQYSTQPYDVDRLIVSAFLSLNKIETVNNILIKSYIIQSENSIEYSILENFIVLLNKEFKIFDIEELIRLFEFVISPADRIINGAIYTPINIRKFIIKETFSKKAETLTQLKISDIACGCGGFLYNSSIELKRCTNKSYAEIFKQNIYGLDIQDYSINRTKLLLSLLAIKEGEDTELFEFNLFVGDALDFNWKKNLIDFQGFDIIIGNPPYVCARNLDVLTKEKLKNWVVCNSGNPDLYIPFFQIGMENLSSSGILGYITMNSFFKSLNGRSLRQYFQDKGLAFKIIDFGAEQIFKSKNTYTCICFLENIQQDYISFISLQSSKLFQKKTFKKINYKGLDSKNGWNLRDNEVISKIESTGASLGDIYKTRHGIATLKNDIYIFKPVTEDNEFYYLQNGSLFQIEKGICRDIINSNKLSRPNNIEDLKEKVIFPYNDEDKPKLLDEDYIRARYPKAYSYLNNKRKTLALRDKGNGTYENWFAFGRTQSLEKISSKLFFPKYSDKTPNFIISNDNDLLFYNGQAIVGHSDEELIIIKKIMESKIFWYYIKTTSKPYSSNYYSLNGNYIRNFGICDLDENEREFLIREDNKEILDVFFENKYDVRIS
ncbi:MAG: N-6 DNA methylase [Bacteroidales bacterium]|nr:N-6 DNA methylase [Bacteroidales bacterium]